MIEEFTPHKHREHWVWDDHEGYYRCSFPGCGARLLGWKNR